MVAQRDTRYLAWGALTLAIVGLALVFLTPGSSYVIHARFLDAGGLVPGGGVELAGRPVGSISNISLTSNGEADVELSLNGSGVTPLHVGTRASIRTVGQAGVTENFVALTPGPDSAPVLQDGGVLPTAQTSGVVNIDALLDSFGPAQRANLDGLITNSANVYAGSGASYFNRMLGELDPALGAIDGLTTNLALDRGALGALVRTGSEAATAIASRSGDLTGAVTHSARALGALASQRAALADFLSRLPGVLVQGRGTLARAGDALRALKPALGEVVPVAPPLHDFLARLDAMLPLAGPVVSQLQGQLPSLQRSLAGLAPLARPATQALTTLGPAMKQLFRVAEGLRYYGSDVIIGSLAALFGNISAEYNAYGHFAKANFVQSLQTAITGPLSTALAAHPLVPGLLSIRTGLTRRCPGGAMPPAPDGSSPWNLGPAWCTPANDTPLSVDFR